MDKEGDIYTILHGHDITTFMTCVNISQGCIQFRAVGGEIEKGSQARRCHCEASERRLLAKAEQDIIGQPTPGHKRSFYQAKSSERPEEAKKKIWVAF